MEAEQKPGTCSGCGSTEMEIRVEQVQDWTWGEARFLTWRAPIHRGLGWVWRASGVCLGCGLRRVLPGQEDAAHGSAGAALRAATEWLRAPGPELVAGPMDAPEGRDR